MFLGCKWGKHENEWIASVVRQNFTHPFFVVDTPSWQLPKSCLKPCVNAYNPYRVSVIYTQLYDALYDSRERCVIGHMCVRFLYTLTHPWVTIMTDIDMKWRYLTFRKWRTISWNWRTSVKEIGRASPKIKTENIKDLPMIGSATLSANCRIKIDSYR